MWPKQHLILTILQAKEQLLVLQQLLYGVQADTDGVHIQQGLQDVGAQPSTTTRGFSVVKHSKQGMFAPMYSTCTKQRQRPHPYVCLRNAFNSIQL